MTLPEPLPAVADHECALAHAPYVRGLARALVFDRDLAKDVEQEAWLAALENEPREQGALRAWLAALVRNFARRAWQSSTRRTAREQTVAVPEASVPSPGEILEREDLRRRLVEAVLALDEPLRSVLALRFFEELPPREIARRLELPVETVRTRTKRGLEILRGRFDREGGKGRAAWCLALVRGLKVSVGGAELAAILVSSIVSGVQTMQLASKLSTSAVLVALAAGAAFHWFQWERPIGTRQESPSRTAHTEPAPPALVEPAAAAVLAPRTPTASATPARPPTGSRANSTAVGSALLRVFWHDGTPAADVAATVHWNAADDFYADAFEVRTGADGTCRFELPPTRVSVYPDRSDDLANAAIVAGEETTIDLHLGRGYDVGGTVMDPSGAAMANAEVLLDSNGGGWGGHVVAHADAAGHFSIRSVTGLAWLHARAPGFAPTTRLSQMAGEGANMSVTLAFEAAGGALEGHVRDELGVGLAGAQVLVGDPDAFAWPGPGEAPAAQRVLTDEDGRFRLSGIAAGTQPIRARASGRGPHAGEVQILAGETTTLDLTLSAGTTVEGTVTDASGNAVGGVQVSSDFMEFGGRTTFSRADGTFRLHSLPAGEFTLHAQHDKQGSAMATLQGTAAVLTWNPVLAGLSLSGTLSMPGVDLTQCVVRCEPLDWEHVGVISDAAVDAQGAFEVAGLAAAEYRLEVRAGDALFPLAALASVRPGGGPLVIQVDPALWPTARLAGRVLDALGSPRADVVVLVSREGNTSGPLLTPSADGTFECGPYPPGRYRLSLKRQGTELLSVGPVDVSPNQIWSFGDLLLAE